MGLVLWRLMFFEHFRSNSIFIDFPYASRVELLKFLKFSTVFVMVKQDSEY